MKFTFGQEVDSARLQVWLERFGLRVLRCRGLFIGNTFIGIVRARK